MAIETTSSVPALSGIPLGGLGTGSVELRADGRFHEWQIFNNPPWSGGWFPGAGDAFDDVLSTDDVVLGMRLSTPSSGPLVRMLHVGGSDLYTMPWLRCVPSIRARHVFPLTTLTFDDPALPATATLTAWSPFVPGNSRDSAIPGFRLELRVQSPLEDLEASFVVQMRSPFSTGSPVNEFDGRALTLSATGLPDTHPMARGSLCLLGPKHLEVTGRADRGAQPYMWVDLRADGKLDPVSPARPSAPGLRALGGLLRNPDGALSIYRSLDRPIRILIETALVADRGAWAAEAPSDVDERWAALMHRAAADHPKTHAVIDALEEHLPESMRDPAVRARVEAALLGVLRSDAAPRRPVGALCISTSVGPGSEATLPVTVGWFFPHHVGTAGDHLGHRYEEWYSSAADVASDLEDRAGDLKRRTEQFSDALAQAGPPWLGAACGAQLTTFVKSSFWVRDGRFGIWEGLGCCGLETLDVTYYGSHPVALFFPELEQAQLRMTADFQLTRESDRYEEYVLAIPANRAAWDAIPEGERSLERVVAQTGIDARGRIPHFFPGSFATVDAYHMIDLQPKFALLALRDARWIGDLDEARRLWPHVVAAMEHNLSLDEAGAGLPYHYDRRKTSSWISSQTYDGWDFLGYSSYVSGIWIAGLDATRRLAEMLGEDPAPWAAARERAREAMEDLLWDEDLGYHKLWTDPVTGLDDKACMADQLSGQWAANLCGLPPILDRSRIRRALRSVLRLCWKGADEGLINGAYPDGARPSFRGLILYQDGTNREWGVGTQADTPWTGTEYATASLMIQEGLVDEGVMVAKAVHDRYEAAGMAFNHIECGGHYYRAMDVWTVLTAMQRFDMEAGAVTTEPHAGARGTVVVAPGLSLGIA